MVWQHPELVATVVDGPAIPTRWFNERFGEVQTANQLGRYYAYGEAPAPTGPPLRRAMTCCCVEKDLNLMKLAETTSATASHADTRRLERCPLSLSGCRRPEVWTPEKYIRIGWLPPASRAAPLEAKGADTMSVARRKYRRYLGWSIRRSPEGQLIRKSIYL